jgi:hypothetical protein
MLFIEKVWTATPWQIGMAGFRDSLHCVKTSAALAYTKWVALASHSVGAFAANEFPGSCTHVVAILNFNLH